MIRVSIIGPAYPLRGGIAHHVYWLKRELTIRGHQVQVISFKRLYPGLLFPGKTVNDTSELKLDPGGLALLDTLNPLTWIAALGKILASCPDLTVIQWWHPIIAPAVGTLIRLLKSKRVRSVIECHNVFPHERSLLDLPLVDFALAPAEDLIAHSKADRRRLLDHFPEKRVLVAPLPFPDSLFTALAGPELNHTHERGARNGRTILFFGMVREYKGLDVLLRAMPRVLSRLDCRLVIAGEFYDDERKYRRIVSDYGIESHVSIDNRYIPNEELPSLFDHADVLVLPYLTASQSGIVRMAAAAALPVIATRTGGLPDAVTDDRNGLVVPPGDSDALAEAISRYFSNNLGPVLSTRIREARESEPSGQLARLIEDLARGGA